MTAQEPVLVTLVRLIDRLPLPPPKRGRGRPRIYPDRPFLKALAIMIGRHAHKIHELLTVLARPTAEMAQLRGLPTLADGRYPTRQIWERQLVAMIQPWAACGRWRSIARSSAPGAACGTGEAARRAQMRRPVGEAYPGGGPPHRAATGAPPHPNARPR